LAFLALGEPTLSFVLNVDKSVTIVSAEALALPRAWCRITSPEWRFPVSDAAATGLGLS
jgi:hypothetical protein